MRAVSANTGRRRSPSHVRLGDETRDSRRYDTVTFDGPVSDELHAGMLDAGYDRSSSPDGRAVYVRDRIAEARRRLGRSGSITIGARGVELD